MLRILPMKNPADCAAVLWVLSVLKRAFPVLYTGLVKTGKISLERLIEAMSIAPAKRFGIDNSGCFTVFDLNESYDIDPDEFVSMGRATPFEGMEVYGRRISTVYKGEEI